MRATLAVLTIVLVAVATHAWSDRLDKLRLAEATTAPAGDLTERVRQTWDFARGPYPAGWGWGDWQVVGETLQLADEHQTPAAYFLPITHRASFRLATEVQVVSGGNGEPPIVHLGTGRAMPDTLTGTGVSLFAGGGPDAAATCLPVSVRHFNTHQKLATLDDCAERVAFGRWHQLAIEVSSQGVVVTLDGVRRVFAELADLERGGAARPALLAGVYQNPYLAVSNGMARFRYLEVGPPAALGPAAAGPVTIPEQIAQPPAALQQAGQLVAVNPTAGPVRDEDVWWLQALRYTLYVVITLVCLYMARHYLFMLNRLFGRQRHPYLDVDTADWPRVTVVIPAHNEESVIGDILEALLEVDYPEDRLRILPINDRSEDHTGDIIESFAERYPARVLPFHRQQGKAGKSAALQDAMSLVDDDIVLVFDADYYPGRGLIKQLVAPFFDPQVGAVMGRVVPYNVGRNLLTRTLDLERAGGYQVDQQARMNMRLVPQYGGTVGGVRRRALVAAGGWRADSLAEDTDATLRLLLAGWKTVYQNRSECYEQVPETWTARMSQLFRWTQGHNQALWRYAFRLLGNRRTTWREKLDGLMVLNIYMMSPVLLLGWSVAFALWFLGVFHPELFVVLLVVSYSALGNFAIFAEIAAATYLDGSRGRIRLLPFMLPCFLVSVLVVSWAFIKQIVTPSNGSDLVWTRTTRSAQASEWK